MMIKFRSMTAVLIVFALVVGVVGFAPARAQDVPDFPVKIATIGPFTGGAASIGQEMLNWTRLAVSDFNAATGWNVELVEGDSQLDPAIAVTVAESIMADEAIFGVVGPAGSAEVEAIGAMFTEASLGFVSSTATSTSLTLGDFSTFFRVVPTDDVQGPTNARYAFEDLGLTQAFVIDDQSSYSVGLADQIEATFAELGGTVVGRESISQDLIDLSSVATVVANSGAEVVFFPGQFASQGALLAIALVEQGSSVVLFGADGFYSPDDFIAAAAGAAEGAYVSSFAPDINDIPTSADAIARYNEAYGEFATTFGPPTYVAAQVILEAMQRAYEANGELTREGVAAELRNTNIELSLLGTPLAFDEKGDVVDAEFYIFQVQGDRFALMTTSGEAMTEEPMATEEAQ